MERLRRDLGHPRVRNQRGRRPVRVRRNRDREATRARGRRPQHPHTGDGQRRPQRHSIGRRPSRHERVQLLGTVRRRADHRAPCRHRRPRPRALLETEPAPPRRCRQARSLMASTRSFLGSFRSVGLRLRIGNAPPLRQDDRHAVAQPQVDRTTCSRSHGDRRVGSPDRAGDGCEPGLGPRDVEPVARERIPRHPDEPRREEGYCLRSRTRSRGPGRGVSSVGHHGCRKHLGRCARHAGARVPLDLLVNNAGIGSWGADRRASARTIATNYFGSRDVTDALLPFIPDGGRIVMVSSGLGELSYMGRDLRPRFADPSLTRPALDSLLNSYLSDLEKGEAKSGGWPSAYSVSKVAMNALTRILARELAPRKISINSVCPGWVRTDMGGPGANRSVPVGARSIVLGAMLPEDATGGFYRDGKRIPW